MAAEQKKHNLYMIWVYGKCKTKKHFTDHPRQSIWSKSVSTDAFQAVSWTCFLFYCVLYFKALLFILDIYTWISNKC